MQSSYQRVDVSSLNPGKAIGVELDGRNIALVNVDGRIYALADECTHMKSRLSSGYVEGSRLVCPAHFGSFEVSTGTPVARPCRLPVKTYRVKQDESGVWVDLAETSKGASA